MNPVADKVYFKNLNSVRFIAAFLVIIHHVELGKSIAGLPNYFQVPFFAVIGKLGVVLFFVLSGFLITYLLSEEEKKKGTISLSKFYLRRVFRIWPLYFFLFGLCFVLSNYTETWKLSYSYVPVNLVMIGLFMTNISRIFFPAIPFFSHTWSVSVEEQFYLFWPLLMKWVKNKYTGILLVIVLYNILSQLLMYLTARENAGSMLKNALSAISVMNIDCMAIGGLFAMVYRTKNNIYKFLTARITHYAICLTLVLLIAFGIKFSNFHYEIYALLFGAFILMVVSPQSPINLEWEPFSYLGKISYGLYMYHPLVIYPLITVWHVQELPEIIGYFLVLAVTAGVASLSYHFLEEPFVKRKEKYTVIPSGNKPTK